MTYSPTNLCSTIGADGLNFSVRNGKRWIPDAINRLNKCTVHFLYTHIVRKRIYSFTSYFRKQPHSATRKREAEHWMYAPEGSHTGKNSCAERKVFGQLVLLD